MKKALFPVLSLIFLIAACGTSKSQLKSQPKVLVFSKTAGFRHESIPDGIKAIRALGDSNRFSVEATEDAALFHPDTLKRFSAIIFLSPTGDVLNEAQQNALQQYIRNGGGYAGIHAATDCEYEWSWYGQMAGGYFNSHPHQQKAKIIVTDHKHISTAHLPEIWERKDEWYDYKTFNPSVKILMKLDEGSYKGGRMGKEHPIAWYHEFEGGRVWYTGLGHTKESYTEPAFLKHILGGIQYAMGK